jgi:membrane protein
MTETSSTLWRRLRWIVARFDEQSCLTIAGSLTFTSLLALVPAMTVVYLGLAFLPAYAALATQAEDFIFENFIPSSSLLVQEKLAEFAGRAEGLTELGTAWACAYYTHVTAHHRTSLQRDLAG